jgi:hypothetical protein
MRSICADDDDTVTDAQGFPKRRWKLTRTLSAVCCYRQHVHISAFCDSRQPASLARNSNSHQSVSHRQIVLQGRFRNTMLACHAGTEFPSH